MSLFTLNLQLVRKTYRYLTCLIASFFVGGVSADNLAPPRSIVFYYGANPIIKELSVFDYAVLEPASGFIPTDVENTKTHWIAYVSVGEVLESQSYYKSIPASWMMGENTEWHSTIIDQSAKGWPSFYMDNVILPLWKKGYSGFFIDTLDAYKLVVTDEDQQKKNRQGLIHIILSIHRQCPGATIILNRGFDLLPAIHDKVSAVALESLYKGWNETTGNYTDVSSNDREWLLNQVKIAKETYHLPVISIDYCPPTDTACSLDAIQRIKALGIVPYVGDGHLQTINQAASN
ncbi:endo alpha-1,4 polygalactosaminidase [Alcaligenaceae bacterium]|nr:endo alpha-1,4 polygalactosaminidase [Alcaligenaceae bacterium]